MYTIITSWNIKSASTAATIEAFWEQGVDEKGKKKDWNWERGKGKGEAASVGYIDRYSLDRYPQALKSRRSKLFKKKNSLYLPT